MYSWGTINIGTTPVPSTLDLTPKIIDSLRGKKIVTVACGYSHSIAITEKGEVFQWGTIVADDSTLPSDSQTPRKPQNSSNFSSSNSGDSTDYTDDDDDYVVVGKKIDGAKIRSSPIVPMPVPPLTGKNIVQVDSGDGFSVALLGKPEKYIIVSS